MFGSVRLGRVLREPRVLPDGDAAVRIALDTQAFEPANRRLHPRAEAVLRVRTDGDDSGGHEVQPGAQQAQARRTPSASISLR